jgi:hypothetical protein
VRVDPELLSLLKVDPMFLPIRRTLLEIEFKIHAYNILLIYLKYHYYVDGTAQLYDMTMLILLIKLSELLEMTSFENSFLEAC